MVICSIVGMGVAAFQLSQQQTGLAALLASRFYTYEISVDRRQQAVTVSGSIGGGFADALLTAVKRAPRPLRIEITSSGGLSREALKAAEALAKLDDVTIVARRQCASACLLILSAGDERLAEADMVLDYHATSAVIATSSRPALWGVNEEAKAGDAFLLARGVPREIVDGANQAGPDQVLSVSAQEALQLGILSGLVISNRRLRADEIQDRLGQHPPRLVRPVEAVDLVPD